MFLCNNAQPASEFSNWQVVNTFLQLINKKKKPPELFYYPSRHMHDINYYYN